MKLAIFNGSPRGKKSNTKLLLDQFERGVKESGAGTEENPLKIESAMLIRVKDKEEHVEMFEDAERVVLAFPLYTDCMPAVVKGFIEALEPFLGRKKNPAIGFVVQSGFPETAHSRYVEKYLEKLARRLGCEYLGTVIKGGVEGLQVKPPKMTAKLLDAFYQLGLRFGKTGTFDQEIIKQLAGKERFSPLAVLGFKLLSLTGLTDIYWTKQLKDNHAYDDSFARPFEKN